MKTIIYRKIDLAYVGMIPKGSTFDSELQLNVFPNFKGKKEDYATLDVPYDYFKLEIKDGVVVAVEIDAPPIIIPEVPPTPIEILQYENAKLKQQVAKLDKALLDVVFKLNTP